MAAACCHYRNDDSSKSYYQTYHPRSHPDASPCFCRINLKGSYIFLNFYYRLLNLRHLFTPCLQRCFQSAYFFVHIGDCSKDLAMRYVMIV